MIDKDKDEYGLFNPLEDTKVKDQISGVVIDNINRVNIANEISKIAQQDASFNFAVSEIDKVSEFIGAPEHILGSPLTKHGEIAEQVEVGIRRARDYLHGRPLSATFEGVPRTGPTDYLIDGIEVQSKFINGISKNLSHVIRHMEENPGYGQGNTLYHIPKDTHKAITQIINGERVEGLSQKSIDRILKQVKEIEERSGKSFTEAVNPSISKYAEVQQGTVHKTLDSHEEELKIQNAAKKDAIHQEHRPTHGKAVKAGLAAGAVGAAVSATAVLYKKAKEGKKFYRGDFTLKDWGDVGIEAAKGGAVGSVSGYSIYMLTNYASLSAPLAGAMVSAVRGVGALTLQYAKGEIDGDELLELGMVVTAESAMVGLSTAIGQAVIPIPVLGAVIGSVAGSLLTKIISLDSIETGSAIKRKMDDFLDKLDAEYQAVVDSITKEFSSLKQLAEYAFNLDNNCRLLEASYQLAIAYGVPEDEAMRTTEDVDEYMRS